MKSDSTRTELMAIPIVAVLFGIGLVLFIASANGVWAWLFVGAAALVLADNELAIHGTNNPGSIGSFVSWGCIRMNNNDITDLYNRVGVGTRVVLTH